MTERALAEICSELAGMLIAGGAEIYRVEDTARRICNAYGHTEAQLYATPANFIITLKDKSGCPLTDTRTVLSRSDDLNRVALINRLSRKICAEKPSADKIMAEIENIKQTKGYSKLVIYISYFTVGFAFAVYFGGSAIEAAFGGLLGLTVCFIREMLDRVRASAFLKAVACSTVISFMAVGFYELGIVPRFDKMIIGATMTMVPGIAMVNSMRDFISGDFISGLYTLTEALLTAAGLAVGVGSAVASAIHL
ncbi:MAG: threonine/serine exporter family protein [Oscillospiraceae bacterium]|nr:threonine/serine exporter family protein [Oscillospiraceae bacterium]